MHTPNAERIAARADLCRLLAACYYEPGPEFGEEKVFEAMRQAAAVLDAALEAGASRLGSAYAAEDLEALSVDYTRLFLGPVNARAQPYGSVWLHQGQQALVQDSTEAVLALYAEAGFEPAEDFRELPDHVSAELEFLYLLIFREAAAWRDNDARAAADAAALRRRLIDQQLTRWMPAFTDALFRGAQTSFYRALGSLTAAFIQSESTESS